jgi:hypothetical protein
MFGWSFLRPKEVLTQERLVHRWSLEAELELLSYAELSQLGPRVQFGELAPSSRERNPQRYSPVPFRYWVDIEPCTLQVIHSRIATAHTFPTNYRDNDSFSTGISQYT